VFIVCRMPSIACAFCAAPFVAYAEPFICSCMACSTVHWSYNISCIYSVWQTCPAAADLNCDLVALASNIPRSAWHALFGLQRLVHELSYSLFLHHLHNDPIDEAISGAFRAGTACLLHIGTVASGEASSMSGHRICQTSLHELVQAWR